ncbi:MAG: transposase [Syntrophorhabdales bacterium]|nr:transposase [Syntrophorhabdales bacterium]
MINRFISSLRYKVEQTIGTLKRTYHFIRMRYKGLAKGDYDSKLS